MRKLVDVFLVIDDNPKLLKRPLLPYTYNSFRIPLFAHYNKNISSWPEEPYYPTENFNVMGIIINGSRYFYIAQHNPPPGRYTLHEENNATWVCIAFDIQDEFTALWMYTRLKVVATEQATYSKYGTKDPDGDPNPPMIIKVPEIKRKADALKYSKLTFENITLNLIWNKQRILLYGGELVTWLQVKENNTERRFDIGRYIIDEIKYNKINAEIKGIDYRYLLNTKFPTDVLTRNDNPYLAEAYINKTKPVMIGIGNGVPGIPLNSMQIYTSGFNKLTHYKYLFPANWIELYKIEIKMDDTWIEVWPGFGNPLYTYNQNDPKNLQYFEKYPITLPDQEVLNEPIINSSEGTVEVDYRQALQNGEYGNDPQEIRMYALWPNASMKDALKYLLDQSKDDSLSDHLENENEAINRNEFEGLANIGLYMDESKPIFEWIELLQSGNIIGGQLMMIDDKISFRVENPNRAAKLNILKTDVLDHVNLQISNAAELQYSGWDLSYKKSWAGNEEGKFIGNTGRYPTADILTGQDLTAKYYRQSHSQQGFNTNPLQQKINIIRDCTSSYRHKIKITVPLSFKYLDLLIYDVVRYVPEVLEDVANVTEQIQESIIYQNDDNWTGWKGASNNESIQNLLGVYVYTFNEKLYINSSQHLVYATRNEQIQLRKGDIIRIQVQNNISSSLFFGNIYIGDINSFIKSFSYTVLNDQIIPMEIHLKNGNPNTGIINSLEIIRKISIKNININDFEWMIYEKNINIENETISFNLIERHRTIFWQHEPYNVIFNFANINKYGYNIENIKLKIEYPLIKIDIIEFPKNTEIEGFEFKGWNTQLNGGGVWFDENIIIYDGLTVYGIWKRLTANSIVKLIQEGSNEYIINNDIDINKIVELWED